jgi:hypothetical protein
LWLLPFASYVSSTLLCISSLHWWQLRSLATVFRLSVSSRLTGGFFACLLQLFDFSSSLVFWLVISSVRLLPLFDSASSCLLACEIFRSLATALRLFFLSCLHLWLVTSSLSFACYGSSTFLPLLSLLVTSSVHLLPLFESASSCLLTSSVRLLRLFVYSSSLVFTCGFFRSLATAFRLSVSCRLVASSVRSLATSLRLFFLSCLHL